MTQLGHENIPVEGSEAAAKRKQQLEYQVPAHDLDPTLCHNLTEMEAEQLQQYVAKLKESCAGQGNVVRIGDKRTGTIHTYGTPITSKLVRDRIVQQLSGSETLKNMLKMSPALVSEKKLSVFNTPMLPDFYDKPVLSDKSKVKLGAMKMNSEAVQSVINNLPYYSSLLSDLKDKCINVQDDKVLGPIDQFYNEYLGNERFQNEVKAFVRALPSPIMQEGYIEQVNAKQPDFNSPLPIKSIPGARTPFSQFQETPARKLNFGHEGKICSLDDVLDPRTGQILIPSLARDRVLYDILNSEMLKNALHNPVHALSTTPLIVSSKLMQPDFDDYPYLDPQCKKTLENMKLNVKGVQSGVVHGDVYDNLFKNLKKRRVNYSFDPVLQPIQELREEMEDNGLFREQVVKFVNSLPHFSQTENVQQLRPGFSSSISPEHYNKMVPSKSTDSGFGSIPPTPNYATYPGMFPKENTISATPGQYVQIPGITDMNMYPNIESEWQQGTGQIVDHLENLNIGSNYASKEIAVTCKGCKESIFSGEVAVKAERAGKDVWHPLCFKCHRCQELLADLVYFFHNGEVYCARDLAIILNIPRCSACDELIFTKEFTIAESQSFHIKHFCCFNCDTPLGGQEYVPDEKTNMPLCLKCYDQYFAEHCGRCSNTIAPQEQAVSWGKVHWHTDCFICVGLNCQKSLIGGRFCVKNDQPFCSPQCVRSVIF